MDMLSSWQYWLLMIFLQFAPLDSIEQGSRHVYTMVSHANQAMVFTVAEAKQQDGRRHLTIQATIEGGEAAGKHTHTATIEGKGSAWLLTRLAYNGEAMLESDQGLSITPCYADRKAGILVSTDAGYRLALVKEDAVVYLYPAELKKSLFNAFTFARDSMTVTVFSNDVHAFGGVIFKDSQTGMSDEFRFKSERPQFIGRLWKNRPLAFKNPSEYCLEDGKLYRSSEHSFMGMFLLAQHEKLDELAGNIVWAEGHIRPDLTQIISEIGPCPADYGKEESMMQIRSDWVGEETGFRIGHSTREKLAKLSYFSAATLLVYHGVKSDNRDGKVEISFTNTLDIAVANLEITAHYESTKGKPQPGYRSQKFHNILPGQTVKASFPAGYKEDRQNYRYHSYIIEGDGERLTIRIE